MKKLLLVALTAITCFSLAGCQDGKKLSAAEAYTELKAIAENTQKSFNKLGSIKSKETFEGSIKAKDVKVKLPTGDYMSCGSGSASAKGTYTTEAALNVADKKAKFNVSVDASAKADVTSPLLKMYLGIDSDSKKWNYEANGKVEAYLVGSEESRTGILSYDKANIYTNIDAKVNSELAELLELTKTEFKASKNFGSYYFGDFFEFADYDEEYDEFDFDFINDWTIFTQKGNTLTADCSNLSAFDVDGDLGEINEMLKSFGLELKISKLQLETNKEKMVTSFDFAMSLKGSLDLSKLDPSSLELTGPNKFSNREYSGTVSVDMTFGLSYDLGYGEKTIDVPENLTKLEEEDFDEFYYDLMDLDIEDFLERMSDIANGGSSKENAAAKKAETLLCALKSFSLEASVEAYEKVEVLVEYGATPTSVPRLTVFADATDITSKLGFTDYDAMIDGLSATGMFRLMYNTEINKFSYPTASDNTLVIDGYTITVSADGTCTATK